jgi:hypothetical protein
LGGGHYLGVFRPSLFTGGHFLLLLGGEEGGSFDFFVVEEADQAGFVFPKSDIVVFEKVLCFLMVLFIDGHQLFALFGGIPDTTAFVTTEAFVTSTTITAAEAFALFAGCPIALAGSIAGSESILTLTAGALAETAVVGGIG